MVDPSAVELGWALILADPHPAQQAAADAGARREGDQHTLAELALGTNPAARLTDTLAECKTRLGVLDVALGADTSVGDTTGSSVYLDATVTRPTVYLDAIVTRPTVYLDVRRPRGRTRPRDAPDRGRRLILSAIPT